MEKKLKLTAEELAIAEVREKLCKRCYEDIQKLVSSGASSRRDIELCAACIIYYKDLCKDIVKKNYVL